MTDAQLHRLWRVLAPIRDSFGAPTARDLTLALFFLSVSDSQGWEEAKAAGRYDRLDSLFYRDDELYWGIRDNLPPLGVMPIAALIDLMEIIDILRQTKDYVTVFQTILESFAERGGLKDGEFYTPNSVARVLTSTLSLESASSIYDPACRFGELLVYANKETRALDSQPLSFRGTALSSSSLNITRMNLRLNGISGQTDLNSPRGRADPGISTHTYSRIIANPPFNQPWSGREEHFDWYAEPPKGNANFGWLQHAIHLLEPGGRAAILMPNSTLFSTNSRELAIRRHMVDEGCVEGIITLPPSMFYNTRIPVCLWLLTPRSDRRKVLLIDASTAGYMATRTRRIMEEPEIHEIADVVSSWRSRHSVDKSQNVGSASLSEVSENNYNLTPAVHLASVPTIPATSNSQSLTSDLMNRLLTLKDEADEKDVIAEQLLRELKW